MDSSYFTVVLFRVCAVQEKYANMSHQKKAYIMLDGSQSDLKGFRNSPVYIQGDGFQMENVAALSRDGRPVGTTPGSQPKDLLVRYRNNPE